MTKRTLSLLIAGVLLVAGASAWLVVGRSSPGLAVVKPTDASVRAAETARKVPGATVQSVTLTAAPATVDLGSRKVSTWAFNGQVPGPQLSLRAGDTLKATVVNRLPQPLTMHWHGIALRNDMDGVPDLTQAAIKPGASFTYSFTVPDAGTYWYHPHTGVQLDRGLYGSLVVQPRMAVDAVVRDIPVMLDDWTDGMGQTPEQVLAGLRQSAGTSSGGSGMDGMDMGGHDMAGMDTGGASSSPAMPGMGADTGDVKYPAYLINGRMTGSPAVYAIRPGENVRLRFVNVGSDTTFQVAVGGARLRVVATDGFDVQPVTVDTLSIAMGERYDVELTAPASGALPIVAVATGKNARAFAALRVGDAMLPMPEVTPRELSGRALQLTDLRAAPAVALPAGRIDKHFRVRLGGSMAKYEWSIRTPRSGGVSMPVRQGERVRLTIANETMMTHPIHLHGHTFQVDTGSGVGPRKDTVLVPAMGSVVVDFVADNPGQWVVHCHNIYHAEVGMMAQLSYVR